MTKGAIFTAAGVLLLVGGGGTLAEWSVQQNAGVGQVASGDLNLVAGAGKWTVNGQSTPIDITTYRIVPGDTLTYTQNVDITLDGENMRATLSVIKPTGVNGGFVQGTFTTSDVTLSKDGVTLANPSAPLGQNDDVTDAVASVSFGFRPDTLNRDSVNAKYDFSAVAFELKQVLPAEVSQVQPVL